MFTVEPNKSSTVEFRVNSLQDIVNVILPHFIKYPLQTKKHIDFLFFQKTFFPLKNINLQDIIKLETILKTLIKN